MITRVLVAAAVIAAAPALHAEPDAKARASELSAAAKQLYAAGDFLAAARAFERAYAADPDPAYLFNIAQAFRFGNGCADSARYYRRFLDDVPSAPNRDDVNAYIQEVDACAERQAVVAPRQAAPPSPPPPAPAHRGGGPRAAVPALMIGGAAALVLGAAFTYDVHALEQLSEGLCHSDPCMYNAADKARERDYARRGRRAEVAMVSSYAAGVAALTAGIVLYLVGRRAEAPVAIAPAPGGAVAALALAF